MTDIKSVWKGQKTEDTVTLQNIRERATKFERRVRRALWREYAGAAFVVVVFGAYIWFLPGSLVKAGSALCVLGTLFVVWQMRKRLNPAKVPDASGLDLVGFHRRQLERQRDSVKSAWLWYIAPLLPGMVLILVGRWTQFHASWRSLAWDHEVIILSSVIVVLALVVVLLVQRLRVLRLQRRIDELDKLV